MWVATQSGNLCNLSLATDLIIKRDVGDDAWKLRAFFPGDSETTLLGAFATREEAVDVLGRIAQTLPARDVQMPARPEPRPVADAKAAPPPGDGHACPF